MSYTAATVSLEKLILQNTNCSYYLLKWAEETNTTLWLNPVCVQVSAQGLQSIPLNLAVSWRCEPTSTDLRIDYKYNGEAMSTAMALNNVQFLVPVDGGVSKLQAVLPPAAWYCLDIV